MIPTNELMLKSAATGWQGQIIGTLLSNAGTITKQDIDGNAKAINARQPLAGAPALATGTYYFFVPTAGCSAVDVTLRMASHTGTVPTITLYPTLSDNITLKGTATSVTALVDATQATTSLTTLRGERGLLLKIVVPAASTATFDQADFSAL